MKLLRAKFKNFRLLRDVELEFSVDPERPLTVIRAENGSGKTTMLVALQWCLYGAVALPGRSARDFRLHPMDWDATSEGASPSISVEVEFETADVRLSPKYGPIPSTQRYRVIRSTTERVEGEKWIRGHTDLAMYQLKDGGWLPMDNPNAVLQQELPENLRGVFFTDGDRALDFIEADTSSKRDKVRGAVRSLLDLEILDNAIRHVTASGREVNQKAQKLGANRNLAQISSRILEIDTRSKQLEEDEAEAKASIPKLQEQLEEVNKRIAETLRRGDKEKLQQDRQQVDSALKGVRVRLENKVKEHGSLFESLELGRDILAPVLSSAISILDVERKQGGFPKTAVPVLRDRLDSAICMCGESLDPDDTDGLRRRAHIEHLIEDTRQSDEFQSILNSLYFGSSNLRPEEVASDRSWVGFCYRVCEEREDIMNREIRLRSRSKDIEIQIDALGDTDIDGLRDTMRQYQNMLRSAQDRQVSAEAESRSLQNERLRLEREQRILLDQEKRGKRILAEARVVEDIRNILRRTYERITKEELVKVSNLMNTYFLRMIGVDPEQGAQIRRTEINDHFDILVYGPSGWTLDPDNDLSGAQRRALTLAFILGLTKVSEVEAPNVIDTPLGMMSGYVKTSVLHNAIQESSQLVLFLTRSEIAGCEDILDRSTGNIVTLTNTSHYPEKLKYDPGIVGERVLQCTCDHRNVCRLCDVNTSIDLEE